jgi:hypothetical protein
VFKFSSLEENFPDSGQASAILRIPFSYKVALFGLKIACLPTSVCQVVVLLASGLPEQTSKKVPGGQWASRLCELLEAPTSRAAVFPNTDRKRKAPSI